VKKPTYMKCNMIMSVNHRECEHATVVK